MLGLAVGPSARDATRDTGTGNLEQYGTNGDITTSGLASEYDSQEYDLLRLGSRFVRVGLGVELYNPKGTHSSSS